MKALEDFEADLDLTPNQTTAAGEIEVLVRVVNEIEAEPSERRKERKRTEIDLGLETSRRRKRRNIRKEDHLLILHEKFLIVC